MEKRGQFQISFGMIFSMFLIVIFLVVAFVVINNFLNLQGEVEERQVIKNLNDEVKQISQSTTSANEKPFVGDLGDTKITHACFFDSKGAKKGAFVEQYEEFSWQETDEEHNLYFYPREESYVYSSEIKLVNMTYFKANPYCVSVQDGKFALKLSKNIGEVLVRIS